MVDTQPMATNGVSRLHPGLQIRDDDKGDQRDKNPSPGIEDERDAKGVKMSSKHSGKRNNLKIPPWEMDIIGYLSNPACVDASAGVKEQSEQQEDHPYPPG